jgi:hypothetical protein
VRAANAFFNSAIAAGDALVDIHFALFFTVTLLEASR